MLFFEVHLIFFWFFFSTLLTFILLGLSFFVTQSYKREEQLTAYECGFDPFESSRKNIDIHFFLVGLLFLLFDIEIAYFFPLVISIYSFTTVSFLCFFSFFWIILLGFIYEWQKGTLNWLT